MQFMNCNVKKTRQKIVWTKFGGCSLTRTTLIWYLFPHIFFLNLAGWDVVRGKKIQTNVWKIKLFKWVFCRKATSFKLSQSKENKQWLSQEIFQFRQLERTRLKKKGFNGIRTRDLRDTSAMFCQLSSYLLSTSAVQIWIISYTLHIISLHGKIWT